MNTTTEERAAKLIDEFGQYAVNGRIASRIMFEPIELKRGIDGTVTGLTLTGAMFASLIDYLYGPRPDGLPKLEVTAVTMTLDMFETLLYLIDQRAAALRQAAS